MSNHTPPNWLTRILEWFCADEISEGILGDLHEAHQDRILTLGLKRANHLYFRDVIRFIKLDNMHKRHLSLINFHMLKNHFRIAIRQFRRNLSYSLINLSGLVIGITGCLLIGLHVLRELSYDDFHPKADNTFRVVMNMFGGGELKTKSAPVFAAVGPGLENDFPEITTQTRILPFGNGVYSVKDADVPTRYNEEKAVLADANFFEMFGFRLIEGDPATALAENNKVVLSESTARKYFGAENPMGKTLVFRGQQDMQVTGVMEDFPDNSHMDFDIVNSLMTWPGFESFPENWGWYDFYTFIRLAEGVDPVAFETKIKDYLVDKKKESYEKNQSKEELWIQPLREIHLHSKNLSWDMGNNGNAEQVYFLALVALIILVIAWINFINLSTARAVKRSNEVGIRKVVGALRRQLIFQFQTESILYNFVAFLVALVLIIALIPILNSTLNLNLDIRYLMELKIVFGLLLFLLIGGIIAGFYPAKVLSSFKPLEAIKSNFYTRRRKFGFRQILVVFQFAASIILILGTIIVVKQLNHMLNHDLGINIEETLVVKAPSSSNNNDPGERLSVFRNQLAQIPEVKGLSISSIVPGIENFGISGFTSRHFPEENRDCYRVRIDEYFLPEYEVNLLAGRNFKREMGADSSSIILNTMAAKHLGFESPSDAVGELVNPRSDHPWKVIGIAENYHQNSLKQDLDPVIFFYHSDGGNYFSLKFRTSEHDRLLASIRKEWDAIYPDNPFDHFYLNEHFAAQYNSDRQFNFVFLGFAVLAIFVASLGLFGLVSFTIEQAQKEIGIRKVLGASVQKMIVLLTKDYAVLILIAMVLAFPLSYFLMQKWLMNFAYRTEIGPSLFIYCAVLVVVVSLLTVSLKSYKAANRNPAHVLRDQ